MMLHKLKNDNNIYNMRIKKFTELSTDIENPIFNIDIEKIKNGEYEIESVLDVILDPKELKESNVINLNTELNGEIKRGDNIYCVVLLRKKGTTSFSSPAIQAVISCKIVNIWHGLSYLNKILK